MRYMLFRIYFIPSQMQFALQQASNGVVHHVFRNSFSILFHFIRLSAPFFFFSSFSKILLYVSFCSLAESQSDSLFRGLFCCCSSALLAFFAHSLSMHFYHHHHPSVLLPYLHTHIFYSHLKYLHLCHVHFSLNRSLNARVHTLNRGNAVCCSCCCCRSRVFFSRAFFFSLANVVFLLLPFVVVSFPSFLFFSLPTPHPL